MKFILKQKSHFDIMPIIGNLIISCLFSNRNGKNVFAGTIFNIEDDLNDYKTPGIYRSISSDMTKTLKNIPEIFKTGFSMNVFYMSDQSNVQIIFSGINIYMRGSNSAGWQNWNKCNISAILSSI